jgi:chromosome segregation protein
MYWLGTAPRRFTMDAYTSTGAAAGIGLAFGLSDKVAVMSTDSKAFFSSGARWVRADFHLHTRADKEFSYTGELEKFNHFYVEALRNANTAIGVVANHNKFDFEEFKSLSSVAKKNSILLLPGVELSVKDGDEGVHAVIVFGPTWIPNGKDLINSFLTGAFPGKTPNEYQQENQSCVYGIDELLKTLADHRIEKRDSFIIWAHVEADKGVWRLGGNRHIEHGKSPLFRETTLGFQKVKTNNTRQKMKQWLGDWYPSEVQGSDPKTIEEIGRGEKCFLKIGEFSFAAVRAAMEDHVHRVASQAPRHKGSYIRQVQFDGGALGGKVIHFSSELNTVIGIRGSGKTAILEAIRYALDIPSGSKPSDGAYKENLVRHILGSGGKVTVTAIDRDGNEYVVSRVFKETPNVYSEGILRPGISIRETVLHKPIYFGQKDLVDAGAGFEDDLVDKLVADGLVDVRTRIDSQKQTVLLAVQRYQKLQNTTEQIADYSTQLADANHRLSLFEKFGVSEKLSKRTAFQRDVATLERYMKVARNYGDSVEELLSRHTELWPTATSQQNPDLFEQFFAVFVQFEQQMAALQVSAIESKKLMVALSDVIASLQQRRAALSEEFAEAERTLSAELKREGREPIRTDDYMAQLARKSKSEEMLSALKLQDGQRDERRDALLAGVEQLRKLWHEEFLTIEAAISQVNQSGSALQITAEFKGNRQFAMDFLIDLFKGSSLHKTKLEKLLTDYPDFVEVFRAMLDDRLDFAASREKFETIFLANLGSLLTMQIPNQLTIKYHGKPLKELSLGQRASALIVYILSQGSNDVILIDQPEDDLDNQSIYNDVITLLQKLKPSTQFIMPTHNPNIPVLGDAEQVLVCNYENGNIDVITGSVDNAKVQQRIVDIMEGGNEAFERRRKVYKQWKSSI